MSASQVADRLTAASAIDLMVCINEAYTYKASELRPRGMLTIYTLADTASVWQASTFSSIFSVTDIGQSYVYRRSAHRQSKDTFEGESAEFYCAARSFIAEIELEGGRVPQLSPDIDSDCAAKRSQRLTTKERFHAIK